MALHAGTVTQVTRWLTKGMDVRITGRPGSGRSTVVELLHSHHAGLRRPAALIRGLAGAEDTPLATFLIDRAWGVTAPGHAGLSQVAQRLGEVFDGEGGTLFIDDAHLLDRLSLSVIDYASREFPQMRIVSALPFSHVDRDESVRHRSSVVVEMAPLGVRDISALVDQRSGTVAGPSVAARIAALSGGNPRIAAGLIAAAAPDGVRDIDERWSSTLSLDALDASPFVDDWCGGLPAPLRSALTVLAWCGPIPLERAAALVGSVELRDLVSSRFAAVRSSGRSDVVVVTPPALARALVHAQEKAGVELLSDLPALPPIGPTAGGSADARRIDPSGRMPRPWWQESPSGASTADAMVVAISSLTERFRVHTALLWDVWRARRSVAAALDLLRPLMTTETDGDALAEIFESTVARPGDSPDALAELALLRGQWNSWRGDSALPEPATGRSGSSTDGAPTSISAIVELLRAGESVIDVARAAAELPPVDPTTDNGVMFLEGAGLVEAGHPRRVLDLWADGRVDPDAPFGDNILSVWGEALLLCDRVDEAEDAFAERLAVAQDELDPFAARLACRGLGTAMFFDGRLPEAWRSLGVAMRLGRGGILTVGYDERILGLASIIRARAGDLALASGLLEELDQLPSTGTRLLDIMLPWARAELAIATDEGAAETTEACEKLWAAGERLCAEGFTTAGLLCGAVMPTLLGVSRLASLTERAAAVDVPLIHRYVALHTAIADGTADEILEAVGGFRPGGPLVRVALRAAAERGADVEPGPLKERLGEDAFAHLDRAGGLSRTASEALSAREVEVLTRARQGLTNAEIAEELFVSVRTVESHMLRGLRKLGFTSRRQLDQWQPLPR
jgi:DNA-binding CsgD family transcriptional regulator